jgi:hypothetical protein
MEYNKMLFLFAFDGKSDDLLQLFFMPICFSFRTKGHGILFLFFFHTFFLTQATSFMHSMVFPIVFIIKKFNF